MALAPILDLWNHNENPNCYWKVTTENNVRTGIQVIAKRIILPNEELFLNYG